jgi:hypothetical protein
MPLGLIKITPARLQIIERGQAADETGLNKAHKKLDK